MAQSIQVKNILQPPQSKYWFFLSKEVEKEFESTEAISDFTDQKRKLIECQETIHHQS